MLREWLTGARSRSVSRMCQYQPECPTTRHRPGTKCPVRVSIENHNRKVDEQNRQAVWTLIIVVALAALAFAFWWFFIRESATGIGLPVLDDLLLGMTSVPSLLHANSSAA